VFLNDKELLLTKLRHRTICQGLCGRWSYR